MPETNEVQARKALLHMKPYSPGKPIWEVQRELGLSHVIKLASNENPLGASPKALAAIEACLADLHRYPDADTSEVQRAIGIKLNLPDEQLIVTNGADELITLLSETYLETGDEIIIPAPTFGEYAFGAHLMGARIVKVPLRAGFRFHSDDLLAAINDSTKLLYICSPNNPTGSYLPRSELLRLLERLPAHVLLVLDSAYSHFADADDYSDGLEFVRSGRPILVLQTFSKVYGLAGIRIGFGAAPAAVIRSIRQVKEPFNVNALAQAAGAAAINDDDHVEATLALNTEGRQQLYAGLGKLGLAYTESMANFVLVELGGRAQRIYEKLLEKGIIIRYGGTWGLPEHVRISVGTREENAALLRELTVILHSVDDGDL